MIRVSLSVMAFSMVFLLTPRIWVEQQAATTSASQFSLTSSAIPVRTLEDSSCLWCEPARPSTRCTPEADTDRIWLNPDDPLPEEITPCSEDAPASAEALGASPNS